MQIAATGDRASTSNVMSVVIPTRNRARLLRDVLDDLGAQAHSQESFEIIVVDDGSTDNTRGVVRDYAARPDSPETRYVRLDHRGVNASRNEGLLHARGDLILFLDDDASIPSTWIQAFLDSKEQFPEAECLGGRIKPRFEAALPRMCSERHLKDIGFDMGVEARDVSFVCGGNMMISRKALDRVGSFSEDIWLGTSLAGSGYGDESEWEARLHRAGGQIVYLPDAWMWHRRGAKELTRRALLRSSWSRGKAVAILSPLTHRPGLSVTSSLWRACREALHALTGCWGGVFDVSHWLAQALTSASLLVRGRGGGYLYWLPHRLRRRLRLSPPEGS